MVYLASPYSHPDPVVREARFLAACSAAAELMRSGRSVFCAVAHNHPIARFGPLPTGWEFWQKQDEAFLRACGSIIVLALDGWRESEGVTAEIGYMRGANKPVKYWVPGSKELDTEPPR